jgi:hypothetical protein
MIEVKEAEMMKSNSKKSPENWEDIYINTMSEVDFLRTEADKLQSGKTAEFLNNENQAPEYVISPVKQLSPKEMNIGKSLK